MNERKLSARISNLRRVLVNTFRLNAEHQLEFESIYAELLEIEKAAAAKSNVITLEGNCELKMIEPNYNGITSVLSEICKMYELAVDKTIIDRVVERTIASPKFLYIENL
jgi:hypothetical protein